MDLKTLSKAQFNFGYQKKKKNTKIYKWVN